MGKFTASLTVDKLALRRLQHLLTGTNLLGGDIRRVLTETIEEGEVKVFSRAPVGETHALAMSVASSVDPRPIPLWAKITADATNGGFRYGWALQGSKRLVYTYRHGPRTGRKTRRWFTGAVPSMRKALKKRLQQTAHRIEGRWRR